MRNKNILDKIIEFLVTGVYFGYSPIIPGTIGTIWGIVIYIFLSNKIIFYYFFLLIFIVFAVILSDYSEKNIFKIKDSPHIVIDEIAGYLITMISFKYNRSLDSIKYLIIGFILFRIMDIMKPFPIKNLQKLEGGIGIVIDDVVSGIIANLFLQFLRIQDRFFNL